MKILLTGASGLVGAAFARAATRRGHHVVGVVGRFTGELPGLAERRALDLADETALTAAVLDAFPEAIVNCAAISEPAVVDADPARAQVMNVALPATLARLAHHLSARCLHISSEQVFDGARTAPYALGDATAPINLYGRQKLQSEQAVHAAAPALAATVRAPLLMGNSPGGRRSTHERLFADWAAGKPAQLYADEFRQPCTGENLAEVLLELCERRDLCGVFHWAGAELLSRHALGLAVRAHFKLSPERAPVIAVTRAERPEIAKGRQACLALDLAPLAGKLKTRPQTLAQQLEELHVPPAARAWYFAG
jgi:dTDP-4-dehydrorhamnose reductase